MRLAVLPVVVLALLLTACSEAKRPRFKAACKPDDKLEKIVCTIDNVGTARGRACLTSRQDLPHGMPLIARRACTGWIAPGETATVVPRFDASLAQCATLQPAEWICKSHIVESERALGENIPPDVKPKPAQPVQPAPSE